MALIEISHTEREYFREQLEKLHEVEDCRAAHQDADEVVVQILQHLELEDLAEAFMAVPKIY